MGLLDKLFGKKSAAPTLMEDIPKAERWLVEAMASSGYELDGTIDSFK